MFTLNNFAILALAGTTIAAPALQERDGGWGGWSGNWRQGGWSGNSAPAPTPVENAPGATSTIWQVETAYVTMTGDAPAWTPAPEAAPAPTPEPSPSPAAFYSAPASSPDAGSWPAPSSAPSTGGYMDVVSKWRAAGGLSPLSEDSTLAANALKTAQDGNGEMKHELNPGSMAQVLAPGNADNFESVYVGGWLCEVPSEAGLNGICSSMSQGWDHSDGETGHADILTSSSYSKIGCGLADGIWACDLA